MKRRPGAPFLISVALHLVLGAALLWVLSIPYPFHGWLERHERERIPVERIGFLAVPNTGTTTPGRSGGDNRPVTPRRRARLVPPKEVPRTVPTTPSTPRTAAPEGGSGPVVGTGGVERGITPSFSDPRLWVPPGRVMAAPKSPEQRLDSAVASIIRHHQDSLAAIAAGAGRKPGDWTFERNGQKYGMDSQKIYLGKISLPTAILALLPLNNVGNPIQNQRERALNFQRNEIMEQAQRAMNAAEFREAVKRIRERKEREHQAELKRREEERKKQHPVVP